MQETWVQFLVQKEPLEKEMQPTLVFLPGEYYREAWRATVHGVPRVGHDLETKASMLRCLLHIQAVRQIEYTNYTGN